MSDGIIITLIICATLVVLAWLNRKNERWIRVQIAKELNGLNDSMKSIAFHTRGSIPEDIVIKEYGKRWFDGGSASRN